MLIEHLSELLKQHALWDETPPSEEALASQTPFACDTLRFEQWLQFIFIPKMRYLIDHRLPLPTQMAIAPMAQQVWQNNPNTRDIIALLDRFDRLLTE